VFGFDPLLAMLGGTDGDCVLFSLLTLGVNALDFFAGRARSQRRARACNTGWRSTVARSPAIHHLLLLLSSDHTDIWMEDECAGRLNPVLQIFLGRWSRQLHGVLHFLEE